MPLPASWNLTTVTATYTQRDGNPATGRVVFVSPQVVVVEGEIIVPRAVVGKLDTTGFLSVQLPSTNDPDIAPVGWTWTVQEHVDGLVRAPFAIEVPFDSPGIDLATVAPAVPVDEVSAFARLALANTFTEPQTLESSFDGGEDDGSPESFDSTSRINLESYQRASFASFGEVVRTFLRKARAKAMHAWYFPDGGYDVNGDPVGTFKPVVWQGAHWRSNDGATLHKHWSVETPDSTGAIQTRLEIEFGDQTVDNAIAGLDKTRILTNLADLVVRCSNGQVLRLSAGDTHNKEIEFTLDQDGAAEFKRWAQRVTLSGADMQFIRYDDAGVFLGPLVTMKRSTGRVGIDTNDPTTALDVNSDKIRVRTAKTPATATSFGNQGEIAWDADFMYVCVAASTWKRVAIASW